MPKARPDLLTCRIDGEVVILDRSAKTVHQLNRTASYIWDACDGRHRVDEIAEGMAANFEAAPEAVFDDVLRSLAEFERLGLLVDGRVDE